MTNRKSSLKSRMTSAGAGEPFGFPLPSFRSRRAAFTLMEMILAIGVAAMVLIIINAALFASLRLRDTTTDAVDAATPLDQTCAFLRRDLACVVTPTNGTRKVLSGSFRVGNIISAGVPEPVAIEMYTTTGALSPNAPWADIQRVTYELKPPDNPSAVGQNLVRSVSRNLLTLTTPDVEDQLMLTGVASIHFSCFDGSQWLDTWDTTGLTSANTNLPVAVRVDIQMAANPAATPIELVVPIDSQSHTNVVLN